MSTTTSIFSFDHGQKKMNKAIGVEQSYISDLDEQISEAIKNYLFDKDGNSNPDLCPSKLVEVALHEFSYNQLVILAGRYLQDKLDSFERKLEQMAKMANKISLNEEDIPENIREFFNSLAQQGQGDEERTAINGDDFPQEVKDFLDSIVRKQLGESDED